MENYRKQVGSPSSSSSFTNDLFGSKESAQPPPASGTFSSIFPPPSVVLGRKNSMSQLMRTTHRDSAGSQVWNKGIIEDSNKNKEGADFLASNKERSSIFQERAEPCPLSSSLYYGSQEDMYVHSSDAQRLGSFPEIKKDGEDDDQNGNNSHSASRGNWWQGSLYY